MQRLGWVIGLRPECIEDYERHHAAVWPEVLAALSRANLRNYTIFRDGTTLFAYQEYVGDDYAGDMATLDGDPAILRWLEVMHPMQVSRDPEASGSWTALPEAFHLD